ncbi:MAG: sortase [Anaerolineaceae bacterium]|nr:sortase [Anaerolineaceae bacterium]
MKRGDIQVWLMFAAGLLLVFWGSSSTVGAFGAALAEQPSEEQEVPVEGFLPYVVPVEPELQPGGNYGGGALPAQISARLDSDVQTALAALPKDRPQNPEVPIRVYIEAIDLNAPVVAAMVRKVWLGGKQYEQWLAPDEFAAGWHTSSARLGEPGNTVLNGHHNSKGEVFRRLEDLQRGDIVVISGREAVYRYRIVNRMIVPEKKLAADGRLENARWISPSEDERLTLVTCWPYESNTHRLILVARRLK